ncbi:MAG: carboxypeptidase regulatory-like domain-containing protein [Deltaproteobacteria bacterium]|nr:carboxypeptidase regulatory-like domain-containing protein [Deltaproteobacteria bacterium]
MRCWGLAAIGCLASAVPAWAESVPVDVVATPGADGPAEPAPNLGYGAMPGGLHVGAAATLPAGTFAVAALGGFGFRSGLLGDDHSFTRGIGDLAFAYAPTSSLLFALSFDGRYDKHSGVAPEGDDGYVGDPHLMIRFAPPAKNVRFGGQLGVWFPGKDAPSVAASAISVDARGFLTLSGFTVSAGFRLDNSAKSVDNAQMLTLQDRVSLGVSSFHAVLAGARYEKSLGKAFVGVEGSAELFVGSGAPGQIVRGGAMAGVHVNRQLSLLVFAEAAAVPSISAADVAANDIKLVPYEPLLTGGLGLQGRFGGPKEGRAKAEPKITENTVKKPVEVVESADVSGDVVDPSGKPVVGAKVNVRLKNHSGTGLTDDKGRYTVKDLPIGKTVDGATTLDDTGAEVEATLDGKKPAKVTLTLGKGGNSVPKLTLEPLVQPGQVVAVVRNGASGKPIAGAVITLEPGGYTATSNAEGQVTIEAPHGTYKARCVVAGYKEMTIEVVVSEVVTVKNFELRK